MEKITDWPAGKSEEAKLGDTEKPELPNNPREVDNEIGRYLTSSSITWADSARDGPLSPISGQSLDICSR
jgi:hypothetical protein